MSRDLLQTAFEQLQKQDGGDSSSLLRTCLTQSVFASLKDRRTDSGFTLLDVVQSGVNNPKSDIGVYAPDAASYTTFALLLDAIIARYHKLPPNFQQPPLCFGDPSLLGVLDPQGKYVLSTRVRCARSLSGYGFNPALSKSQYEEIESHACQALKKLPEDLRGTYNSLASLSQETKQKLRKAGILFGEPDQYLQAAKGANYWPAGRGIFLNEEQTLVVWVNEEDHLRIISMDRGSDLSLVYSRFVAAVGALGKSLNFARSDKLGYLAFCPSNLGTGMRISVHMRLPSLMQDSKKLELVSSGLGLQIRGMGGDKSELTGAICDVSVKRRLGCTEDEVVQEFQYGVTRLIHIEEEQRSLSAGCLQP